MAFLIFLIVCALGFVFYKLIQSTGKTNTPAIQNLSTPKEEKKPEAKEAPAAAAENPPVKPDNPPPVKKAWPRDLSKMTPHERENEEIKRGILDNMELGVKYTIADMLVTFDCFPEVITAQRLSALLNQLGERGTGEVIRTEENGKAYFSLAEQQKEVAEESWDQASDMTPEEIEKEKIMNGILVNMKPGVKYMIADMLISFDCFPAEMTAGRLNALLSRLGEHGTGEVIRTEEKGKAYFALTKKGEEKKERLIQTGDSFSFKEKSTPRKTAKSASPSPVVASAQNAPSGKSKRINFFCSVDTINAFFERGDSNDDYYIDSVFTVDVIDTPLLLFYKSDRDSCDLEIDNRYEVYKHEENQTRLAASAHLKKGEGLRGKASDEIGDLMPAFMVFCNDLSVFMKKNGYDKKYAELDPEEGGILLEVVNGNICGRLVKGDERPDLMCKTLSGNVVSCRPYRSDIMKQVIKNMR